MSSPALDKKFVSTSFGDIAYLETGSSEKPPVLFVHGIPTSSYLWRHPMRFLQNALHCYAPDLMGLGDTRPAASTRFDMEAQAEMLGSFMTALGHEEFGLVCHDQGGAAAQILAGRFPDRVRAFVLTDCVCYDNWPVPAILRLQRLTRIPFLPKILAALGVLEWIELFTPFSNFRRGVHDRSKLSNESIREYLRPMSSSGEGQERFERFLMAGHPRYTELIVPDLKKFTNPTMVIWAGDDYYLSPSWGRRLYEDIPGAERFELVPFCGHFWQEERPSEFSSIFGEFLVAHLVKESSAAEIQEESSPPPSISEVA